MEALKASAQYGDWDGTASADGAHSTSIEKYLKNKALISDDDFVISISFYILESSTYISAFTYAGGQGAESIVDEIARTKDPISYVRSISHFHF